MKRSCSLKNYSGENFCRDLYCIWIKIHILLKFSIIWGWYNSINCTHMRKKQIGILPKVRSRYFRVRIKCNLCIWRQEVIYLSFHILFEHWLTIRGNDTLEKTFRNAWRTFVIACTKGNCGVKFRKAAK